ncbi:hypothetical protein D3C80_1147640 [compost metagenome]
MRGQARQPGGLQYLAVVGRLRAHQDLVGAAIDHHVAQGVVPVQHVSEHLRPFRDVHIGADDTGPLLLAIRQPMGEGQDIVAG